MNKNIVEEVEVKPRYVPTEEVAVVLPPQTPAVAQAKAGFWDAVYEYRSIITISVIITILCCVVIYYFWRQRIEEKVVPAPIVTPVTQPAPQPTQQQPPPPAQQAPQQTYSKADLQNIAKRAGNNANKAAPQRAENVNVTPAPQQPPKEPEPRVEDVTDEPVEDVALVVTEPVDATPAPLTEEAVLDAIAEATDAAGSTSTTEARCIYRFKNGKQCRQPINSGTFCSKHPQ